MLEKIFENNPLGIIALCATIVGTGYVMNYRLDNIDKTQAAMAGDIQQIRNDVGSLQSTVAGLQAVSDYKEKIGK
nr:hypothetical protein [uncultured Vibrio sp.]